MKIEKYYKLTMNDSDWMLTEDEFIEFSEKMKHKGLNGIEIEENKVSSELKQYLAIKEFHKKQEGNK